MCPPPPRRRQGARAPGRVGLLLAVAAAVLAGCGPPPQPTEPPPPLPNPSSGIVTVPPTFPGQPPGGGPGFPTAGISDQFAIDCDGEPSDGQVLALLVAEDLLDDGADAEFVIGPLCAGDWQYAVVSVANLDPLQVVTSGEPDDLELIAAGTEICTPEVRIQAPPGIRTAAACGA